MLLVALWLAACQPAAPRGADTGPWRLGADLEVAELADGIWIHTSWRSLPGEPRFPSNGLIVRDGEQLILVDTAWGVEPTERLLDWIDATLRRRVALAVITHFHDDRLGGGAALARRGIEWRGLPLTRALAGELHPEVLANLRIDESITIGPLEVYYPGPAHTSDNLVVWHQASQVLFGGCAVRPAASTSLGNVADADLDAWPQAIRRMQLRYAGRMRQVLPSHGPVGGESLLGHTLALLQAARRESP